MSGSSTFYDDLGVRRSATPEQIKVAYIALVKRVHPDSGYDGEIPPGIDVRRINAAYSTLKDPRKRRAYDLELDIRRGQLLLPRSRPAAPVGRRAAIKLLLLAAVLVLAAEMLVSGERESVAATGIASSAAILVSSAQHLAGSAQADAGHVAINPELRSAAYTAMASSTGEALKSSGGCYARAREQSSAGSADRCVVFDLAFEYWHQNDAPAPLHPYFEGQNVERRALESLSGFGAAGAAERLDALRAATFSLLLEEVKALSASEDRQAQALETEPSAAPAAAPVIPGNGG